MILTRRLALSPSPRRRPSAREACTARCSAANSSHHTPMSSSVLKRISLHATLAAYGLVTVMVAEALPSRVVKDWRTILTPDALRP
jgi:hypothetical protein